MSKPTPYYVVLERPKHAKHERPVWGHPVRGVAEDDMRARNKSWGHLSVYRVAVYVEDASESFVEAIRSSVNR